MWSPRAVSNTFATLRSIDAATAVAWIKTISNGWCTSYRMQEEIKLPCVFGCYEQKDTLKHYLECSILISIVHELSKNTLGPNRIHRLLLASPTKQAAIQLAMMYNAYHTTKVGHRETVLQAITRRRFAKVISITRSVVTDLCDKYRHLLLQDWICQSDAVDSSRQTLHSDEQVAGPLSVQ